MKSVEIHCISDGKKKKCLQWSSDRDKQMALSVIKARTYWDLVLNGGLDR